MEDKNKIYSYMGIGSGAIMILCVFLPYISAYSTSVSMWSAKAGSRFLFILIGLAVIAAYLFNKETKLTYMACGYGLFYSLEKLFGNGGFNNLSVAFYLLFIASIAMTVAVFLYDEAKGSALINLTVTKAPTPNVQPQYAQPQQFNQQQYAQPQQFNQPPQQPAQVQPQYTQPNPAGQNQFNYNNNQNGNPNM